MRILVTGGAGYIGSQCLPILEGGGHALTVLDNLSTGHRAAVTAGELVVGDLADRTLVERLFRERRFDGVMHFAGKIDVGESMRDPLLYYRENACHTGELIAQALRWGTRFFIFSSTAAVYGLPRSGKASERTPPRPINPYGTSKWMAESMLQNATRQSSLRYVIFRYFNVAGADPEGLVGPMNPNDTHLIRVGCQAALGMRAGVELYGEDYPTPDGTCIRDYLHVADVAQAHKLALDYLAEQDGASTVLNLGNEEETSVRSVLMEIRRTSGVDFPIRRAPRREGDPARLVASSAKAKRVLGWKPRYPAVRDMVEHALAWERVLEARQASGT